MSKLRVMGQVYTDEGHAYARFDAAQFLRFAHPDELRALAAAGWAGEPAESVARWCSEDTGDVLEYAERRELSLTATIDVEDAEAWLQANRPALAAALIAPR